MEGVITSGTVTLDIAGHGELSLGPQRYGEEWRITRIITDVAGVTLDTDTRWKLYLNNQMPSNLLDNTLASTRVVSEPTNDILLRSGDRILSVWDGSSASPATLILIGKYGRRGFI